nr:hypothetical protein [Tanacetum cinerariifolium]GEV39689.1 hypothetical protein [Tanacetum cinerariifolium]
MILAFDWDDRSLIAATWILCKSTWGVGGMEKEGLGKVRVYGNWLGKEGKAVSLHVEGTFMLVVPDAFFTMVANLFKLLLLLIPALPSETEVSEPKPLTLEGGTEVSLGVKKADLVSFKISDKSSSFTFKMAWAFILGRTRLSFIFYWPVWDLDASVVDSDVCFEDHFLLSLLLAPGFLPWGISSGCEEGFGALEFTGASWLHMAFMWSVKGGKKWFGLLGLSRVMGSSLGVISGDEIFCDDDSAILSGEGFKGSAEASSLESMFIIPSSTINLLKVGSSRGLVKISGS